MASPDGSSKEPARRVELRTERLLLRPFRTDDVDAILTLASDPAWSDYLLDVAQPYSRRDAEKYIARALLASWETTPSFAIVLGTEVIGEVYLGIDTKNETAELGYAIGRAQWGKGFATEAAMAVIDWGFRTYDLAKIYGVTDPRNERSARVMVKAGMTAEGVLRDQVKGRGGRLDAAYYGILREERHGLQSL